MPLPILPLDNSVKTLHVRAIRCNFAYRALSLIVDGVEISVSVAAGAFDTRVKPPGWVKGRLL